MYILVRYFIPKSKASFVCTDWLDNSFPNLKLVFYVQTG